jgi:hypothetical protein
MSPRKLEVAVVALVTGAVVAVVLTVTPFGPPAQAVTSRMDPGVMVSPTTGGKYVRFMVRFTSHRATGVFGHTRRAYIVKAHAVRPAIACVNNRDSHLSGRPAGTHMRATLDPARGDGGSSGWCRGIFRGTVTYSEAYACPAKGRCRPPKSFANRTHLIGRFSFRVR